MSSGRQHAKDSINLAPISLSGATIFVIYGLGDSVGFALLSGLISAIGCLAGILFTPDLDINGRTLAERLPLIGWVWYFVWLPYALLIPHRSILSHWPIMGTLGRQVYFGGLLWLLFRFIGFDTSFVSHYASLYYAWFFGLCVSDLAHWLRDV